MDTENKKHIDWKRLGITTLIVILASSTTFLATWYVLDKSTNEQNEVSDKLRTDLQKQIDDLATKLKNSSVSTSTNSSTSTTQSTNSSDRSATTRYPHTYANNDCSFTIDYPSGYKITYGGQENAILSSAKFWAPDNGFSIYCSGGDASLIKSWSDYSTGSLAMKYKTNPDGSVSYDTVSNNGKLISIQFSDPNNSYQDLKTKMLASLTLH
jgi:hypothetical protein